MENFWRAYGGVYDIALRHTATYQQLLSDVIGCRGLLPPLPPRSIVLDLGCGTGNVTHAILGSYPQATVIAIDHDPSMLGIFRRKLGHWLVATPTPGRVVLNQADVS